MPADLSELLLFVILCDENTAERIYSMVSGKKYEQRHHRPVTINIVNCAAWEPTEKSIVAEGE